MLEDFVCVRLIKANALDLALFQFDYDLTFAAFFMNADKTIYGRYGTRSSREDAVKDVSLDGLATALEGALLLHKRYPNNKGFLAGKQPVATKYKTPDDLPSLRGKFKETLDYNGAVTKSCLHCHQVCDAQRDVYRSAGKPIPDNLLFPYPVPETIGLALDPATRGTVAEVEPDSPAAAAGLEEGDELILLDGQAILSIADVQWVLHNAGKTGRLTAVVKRDGERPLLTIELKESWRRNTDISWRVTSWELRRMVLGGLKMEELSAEDRATANLDDSQLALRVAHVGQYGAHAVAKQAGFKKGDIIVEFNGVSDPMTTSQLLAYGGQNTKPGERIPVNVLRNGKTFEMTLRMQ